MVGVRLPPEVWIDAGPDVEALLDEWLVRVGDEVESGQHLANAIVVKTTCEVFSPAAGSVASILVARGESFGPEADLAEIQQLGSE